MTGFIYEPYSVGLRKNPSDQDRARDDLIRHNPLGESILKGGSGEVFAIR
jgi:hypothetical protein